jgi:DNA polymerase I-like protein with 3'-5' exonuclease and polymerase domains
MTLYGSGIENVVSLVAKLAKVQITFKQGQSLVNALWSAFPGLYSFNVRLQNQARRQGYITTCMGFKIMAPDNVIHCMLNYLCQTTAAHVMKMFLYQIFLRLKDKYSWCRPAVVDVHDATFWMVKEEREAELRLLFDEALFDLNETFKFPIKFRLSTSTGKTLYHAKGGH